MKSQKGEDTRMALNLTACGTPFCDLPTSSLGKTSPSHSTRSYTSESYMQYLLLQEKGGKIRVDGAQQSMMLPSTQIIDTHYYQCIASLTSTHTHGSISVIALTLYRRPVIVFAPQITYSVSKYRIHTHVRTHVSFTRLPRVISSGVYSAP